MAADFQLHVLKTVTKLSLPKTKNAKIKISTTPLLLPSGRAMIYYW